MTALSSGASAAQRKKAPPKTRIMSRPAPTIRLVLMNFSSGSRGSSAGERNSRDLNASHRRLSLKLRHVSSEIHFPAACTPALLFRRACSTIQLKVPPPPVCRLSLTTKQPFGLKNMVQLNRLPKRLLAGQLLG